MPKKKGLKASTGTDFTINDYANASRSVNRVKKSQHEVQSQPDVDLSWDQIQHDDLDIIEETDAGGNKTFVYKKKKRTTSKTLENIDDRPGLVYPEIVWYLISKHIKPEQIGNFAGINKATYAITKRESFWRDIYKTYCENNPKLPEKLKIEKSFKSYGLKQRVIRALYHTYSGFMKKVTQQAIQDSRPHELVKRRCVNVWYCKGTSHWSVYFKLKKARPYQRINLEECSFIEELSKIDANPEEDSQVLQVTCQNFYEVPPLMGMILSSVNVGLSQGFRHHRLHLGFNTGHHNISRDILPECSVVIDTVVNIYVFDWWHPRYPHFDNKLPSNMRDEEMLPVLKEDFFAIRDSDL